MKDKELDVWVDRFKATINKEKDFLGKKLSKVSDTEIYIQAIYLGYLDASRTFVGQDKVNKGQNTVEEIANSMKHYIDGLCNDFDSMFYGVCQKLCDKYNMKFGQAQKIINMACKYLFCVADEEIKDRFDKCHMPLDGIMLEWIHRNIKDENNKYLKKASTWSKLDEGEDNTVCTYRYYKRYVEKYCKDNGKTPLQLDFENWIAMTQILAAENYIKTFTKDEFKQNKHITMLEKISGIKKQANTFH